MYGAILGELVDELKDLRIERVQEAQLVAQNLAEPAQSF